MNKVVIITGPTAVGKTKLSLEIATNYQTDIINGDAFQVYKEMNIGTAKPTEEEMKKVKHHLIDIVDPRFTFSVADYQKEARKVIDELISINKLPLIVGGTGLYIDAIVRDYRFDASKRTSFDEDEFDNYTNKELHQLLERLNKEDATRIHPNNRKRVLRAIELNYYNDEPEKRRMNNNLIYEPLIIFLNDNRNDLYDRINKRVDNMIKDGLVNEVINLVNEEKLGLTASQAIGYKQLILYTKKEVSLEEAIDEIKKATRHFAKRQITWFNHRENITMINIENKTFDELKDEVIKIINNFIEK